MDTTAVRAGLITPQDIESDNSWATGPSQLELIQTHYRVPAQVPYRLPDGSIGIDVSLVLAELVDDLCGGNCCTGQAIKKFDELLGLCSNNFKSFTDEYCPEHDGLFEATKNFLCAVAGQIAKNPFDESENVDQANNGGVLAAARFLAPYVYVLGDDGLTMFLPEGEIFYAYQRGALWQESLPESHHLDKWEAGAAGRSIFEAIECQLRQLKDLETDVKTGTKTLFCERPIDVPYGAYFFVDSSVEKSSLDKSGFVLADGEMGEQIQMPEPVWESFAKQFGSRSFVNWQIDEGFEIPFPELCQAYGSSDPILQIHDADSWAPLFTSALVLADTEVPLTVTVSDVYGNTKIFHTTLTVKNNINEKPLPEIQLSKRKAEAGETITASLKGVLDNPDDKDHDLRWEIYQGNMILAQGTGEKMTFTAPRSTTETKLKVKLIVDDRHSENNIGTKEARIKVAPLKIAKPSGPPTEVEDPLMTSLKEKTDLAKVFQEKVTEVAKENVEEKFPDAVIEAIILPQQVKFYDLTFLVDSSGSMHTKLEYLKPQITEIITTLKNQIMEPGMIRINFFTYGNEETHAVGNGTWISANQLNTVDFTARLDATIKYVAEHNLDLETAWYTVWDLYEGPSQKSWEKPENKDGEYEHRMVILSDEEVDSPENVAQIPTMTRSFDKTEAQAFVARHPNTSLKIIELSAQSKAECEKQKRDILRGWEPEVVVYEPANNKQCPTGMSYIPARSFLRGSCEEGDEGPLSIVKEDAYCLDQTEMTNEQYEKIMKPWNGQEVEYTGERLKTKEELKIEDKGFELGKLVQGLFQGNDKDTGSKKPDVKTITIDATPSREGFNGPNQSVVDVSWYHADLACKQQGKRLPTEAEWENAAKGPDGTLEYPTNDGSEPSNQNNNANFSADTSDSDGTSDVGIYPEGPFGTKGMAGNAWEWTSDWYAPSYDANSLQNPTGPANGEYKVRRGGSWDRDGRLRSAARDYNLPVDSYYNFGLRCARSSSQDSK